MADGTVAGARIPCISVGNLAMGGRGKTPLVAHLARRLVDAGHRPAILSRGYRRRQPDDGVVVVSDGVRLLADLDRSGDEPLMLAREVPGAAVLVCDVRTMAAEVAVRALGATVLLLDDGFQHTAMRRDIDIVTVSRGDLRDRRAPFGRLRSSVSALRRAHAILIDEPDADDHLRAELRAAHRMPVFHVRRSIGAPVPIEPMRGWPAERGPILALAGIAEPRRFTRALEGAGWSVADSVAFRDHHPYSRRDLDRIARRAADVGAVAVLTTAKDAVRLMPLRPLPLPIAAVPLEVVIEPADAFDAWFRGAIAEAVA